MSSEPKEIIISNLRRSTTLLYVSCILLTIASFWMWSHLATAFGNIHYILFHRLDAGLEGHLFHLQVYVVDAMLFATGLFVLFLPVGWLEGRLPLGAALTLSAVLLLDRLWSLHFFFTNEYFPFRWYALGSTTSLFGEFVTILSVTTGFALAWMAARWLLARLPRPFWQAGTEFS